MTRDQIVAAIKANLDLGPRTLARRLRTTPGTIAGLQHRLRHPPPERRRDNVGRRFPHRAQTDLDPESFAALKTYCAQTNQTTAEALRDLLEWALEEFPNGV